MINILLFKACRTCTGGIVGFNKKYIENVMYKI